MYPEFRTVNEENIWINCYKNMSYRREFLKQAACVLGAAALSGKSLDLMAGNQDGRIKFVGHVPGSNMDGFIAPKLDKVRVGVIGVGGRGTAAVHRLCNVPGVQVTALCELVEEKALRASAVMKENGFAEPKIFIGPEAYKEMCDSGLCDAVHINTNWESHSMLALYSMRAGLHTFVEVPGIRTIDEAWEMVETCEKEKVHCMMLANCCYGDDEMLMINAASQGILDELCHAEAEYIHETRGGDNSQAFLARDAIFSSLEVIIHNTGMVYPMHALGPVALSMNINRGDRMTRLVSMGSQAYNWQEFARRKWGDDAPVSRVKFEANDFNTTIISTANGKTILLRQCNNVPGPYSRQYHLYGFKGRLFANPLEVAIEEELGKGADWMDDKQLKKFKERYQSGLWTKWGEIAKTSGGHGGMDYMMDLRWSYCLRNGLPLDTTVYDLASWCSVIPLSQESVRGGSKPVEMPDFTKGQWRVNPPVGEWSIDMDKL